MKLGFACKSADPIALVIFYTGTNCCARELTAAGRLARMADSMRPFLAAKGWTDAG
jgi:hypothetical protein